jgi:hypothetical protein
MKITNLLCAIAVVSLSSGAAAQSPLPTDMQAVYVHNWADEMWLPVQLPADVINARITYENTEANRVRIKWFYEKTGARSGSAETVVDLAFQPTAIARHAGTSMKFYVVGWSERTGRVVVESWTFGTYSLGSAMPPGGGVAKSVFSVPAITRVLEWVSEANTVPPIWDAACQVYGNKLLLLTSGAPTRILSLNLTTLALTTLYNATGYPALAGHRMLIIGRHGADGMLAVSEPRRVWDNPMSNDPASLYFVMRDTNVDGTFDATSSVTSADFYYVYAPPWDNKYTAP